MKNNQERGSWVSPTPSLAKKYRETNFKRTKSDNKLERRVLVKKAMPSAKPPTIPELARRFMVSIGTIKSDIKAIVAEES